MERYYDPEIDDYVSCASESLPDVVRVEPLAAHQLHLQFSDGKEKIYDVSPLLSKGVFKKLESEALFRQAKVEYGTVVWNHGEIDIAPETLYQEGVAL
jgi:hypothetical protein